MVKKKESKLIWYVLGGLFVLFIIFQPNLFKKQDMVIMKVHYWNEDKEISVNPNNLASIITPSEGGIYDKISFDIVIKNTGTVNINNTQIISAYPYELKAALPTNIFNLYPGQYIILNSKNLTTSALEKYNQPINFYVNISGVNLYEGKTITTGASLPLTIVEEAILLRFEKPNNVTSVSDFMNSWLAYDIDGDWELEGFGSTTSSVGSTEVCAKPSDSNFIAYYGSYTIQKESSTSIRVCKNKPKLPDGSDYIRFNICTPSALNSELNMKPVSSYWTREVYVGAAKHVCGNNIKESIELCDGNDLGGKTCENINKGYIGGTLTCTSCVLLNTAGCISGNSITFRTSSLTYSSNSAIAYTPKCGTSLNPYEYHSTQSGFNGPCADNIYSRIGGCGFVNYIAEIPGKWLSDSDGVKLYSCNGKPGVLYVCDHNPAGSSNEYSEVKSYKLAIPCSSSLVDLTQTIKDSTKEIVC